MENNMSFFWKKKEIVSYVLSIFVFWIHISSFANYPNQASFISNVNTYFNVLFTNSITSFAVPLFFIISGVLFFRNYSNKMYFSKVKSRIKTLVIPFLIWNIVWMFFEIVTSYSVLSNYFVGREKFVISPLNIVDAIFHYGCNGPFWFIFELFFFIVISPVIGWMIDNKYRGVLIAIGLMLLSVFGVGLPYPLFYSQTAISFYIIGGVIGKHYFETFSKKSCGRTRFWSLIILLCSIVIFFICNMLQIKINEFVKSILIVLCSLSFWNVIDYFVDSIKNYEFFHQSFAVYAIHINLSAIICKLLYLLMPQNELFAIPNFVLTTVITLLTIHLFCNLLKRFMPSTYKLVTGTR